MDLRYLRYFVTVAEKMNFTRAAEQLGTSQPALSVQIRKLEYEVGVDLFDRSGRGVKLTPAGALFLERARKTLAEMERSIALARLTAKGESGQLSIAYETSSEFLAFPGAIPKFQERWPKVHLKLANMKSFRIFEGLRNDEIDIGLILLPAPEGEFDIAPLVEFSVQVAIPSAHPLAKRRIIRFEDLSGEPLVMFTQSSDPEQYRAIEQQFLAVGASINVALEVNHLISGINFVSMGMGCCILGEYLKRFEWPGVTYRPLAAPALKKTLALAKRKASPPTLDVFYEFFRDIVTKDN